MFARGLGHGVMGDPVAFLYMVVVECLNIECFPYY